MRKNLILVSLMFVLFSCKDDDNTLTQSELVYDNLVGESWQLTSFQIANEEKICDICAWERGSLAFFEAADGYPTGEITIELETSAGICQSMGGTFQVFEDSKSIMRCLIDSYSCDCGNCDDIPADISIETINIGESFLLLLGRTSPSDPLDHYIIEATR